MGMGELLFHKNVEHIIDSHSTDTQTASAPEFDEVFLNHTHLLRVADDRIFQFGVYFHSISHPNQLAQVAIYKRYLPHAINDRIELITEEISLLILFIVENIQMGLMPILNQKRPQLLDAKLI